MRRVRRHAYLMIVGFYQDQVSAPVVYREISRRTGWRVATMQKRSTGKLGVRNGIFPLLPTLLGGGGLGFLLGLRSGRLHLVVALSLLGLLLALGVAHRFARRIEPAILARLRPLLVPEETALVALVPTPEAGRVLTLFRRAEEPTAVFAFPHPALRPEPVIEIPKREEEVLERPENHARRLAGELESGLLRRPARLAPRLRLLRIAHAEIRRRLAGMSMLGQGLTAGGEWFLDNAYLLQGQLMELERSLKEETLRRVPAIVHGPYAGFPRVYALAAELVSSVKTHLTRETTVAFLRAYQDSVPLSSTELWAFPLFLRLVLLERAAEVGLRVALRQQEEEEARFWADRLRAVARREPERLPAVMATLAAAVPTPRPFFALRLVGHLQDETSLALPVQEWLERRLDLSLAEAMVEEHAHQTTDQVEIANAVNSLRMLGRLVWSEIFPMVSLLEELLGKDPAGVYPGMDEETRAAYRAVVEEIARRAGQDELAVARAALRAAEEEKDDPRRGHLGYYLVDAGRDLLEKRLAARSPWPWRLRRGLRRQATPFYLGGILFLTLLFAAVAVFFFRRYGVGGPNLLLAAFLVLFPASEMGVGTMNQLVMRLFPPRILPRMSFAGGIPSAYRTLVVVPMMLSSPETIRTEAERLEVRYLANPDPGLYFALLADFVDASSADTPADDQLLREAVCAIRERTARYGENRFYLLHRERRFSRSEGRWIGRERKRGKLEELNRLLNGRKANSTWMWVNRDSSGRSVMYSPSTPIPSFRRRRPAGWWRPWPIRSTDPGSTRKGGWWWRVTPSSNRGSVPVCPASPPPFSAVSSPMPRGSTNIVMPSPMSIRT
ncbi:MAG: hypothetical protein GX493_00295 [Firmicutes bacterium]|nr:hypothetical protein [Bacillota bacterium]